jgi:galactokinase
MPRVLAEPAASVSIPAPKHIVSLSAPARVNLLGEHTDYTAGLVLPLAIPFYTTACIAPHMAQTYSFKSDVFAGNREFSITETPGPAGAWSDYPVGIVTELQKLGLRLPPFELQFSGTVPLGAGLSSSASIEMASCLAMLRFCGETLPSREVALLCQRAENHFVGSPCGIMDQFVIAAAVAHHALLINTRDLTYDLVPLHHGEMKETCLVVFNSMVKHSIANGTYRERRKEVEVGQAIILQRFPELDDLGCATMAHLEACAADMPANSFLRCRHIVSENARVRLARDLLREGSLEVFGQLLLQAHFSQRDDFACSYDETDFLVEAAMQAPGCFGARMTGGGFGGCTVNLVRRDATEEFIQWMTLAYRKQFGIEGEAYQCEAVDGAMKRNGFAST